MKKIISTIILVFVFIGNIQAKDISVIDGVWDKNNVKKVFLYKVENCAFEEIASSEISKEGKFAFAFFPEKEGFYIIGNGTPAAHRYTFYFKPGDNLSIIIKKDGYTLTEGNTAENIEMAKWHEFISVMEQKAVTPGTKNTYVDFFPLFEEKCESLNTYPEAATANTEFNRAFEKYKKYNFLYDAILFLYMPRTAHPQDEDYPDFYRNINISELTKSSDILNFPDGINLITNCIRTNIVVNKNKEENPEKYNKMLSDPIFMILESNLDKIINDTIKGEIVLRLATMNRTYEGLLDYKLKYDKLLVTELQKDRMRLIEGELNNNSKGTPAIDFKFTDINGKEVALSDFKGKVVYIDIWATWCGPCKKEVPHLKKLEEAYHENKDIVFMGISVDISKDKNKWESYLKSENLKGIQLFAGDAAQKGIMQPYKIKGIPRFMLIDRDGKIISADAPRPSSNEIKVFLDAALKKK